MESLARQDFDSHIFGLDYYRVTKPDSEQLEDEIASVIKGKPVIIDAKVPAEDAALHLRLTKLGLSKACMQIVLENDLTSQPVNTDTVKVSDSLDLSAETINTHAGNFTKDRFALDPRLPAKYHDLLYQRWLTNSLTGKARVASIAENICTFKPQPEGLTIDLVSCLEPGKGIGRLLVEAVVNEARAGGKSWVRVTTECENRTAWRLYIRCGFQLSHFSACYFLVSPANALTSG